MLDSVSTAVAMQVEQRFWCLGATPAVEPLRGKTSEHLIHQKSTCITVQLEHKAIVLSLSLLVLFPSSFICSMSNLSGSSGLWVWAYPLMILDGCCPSYQVSWRPLAVRKYVFAGEMPVAPAYASRPIHPASLWCIWLSGFPAGLELPASHCRDCRGKGIQKSREQKNMEIQGHLHLWWKGRHRYMQVVRQTDWLSLETKWDNDTYTRNAQIPAAHVLNMDTSKQSQLTPRVSKVTECHGTSD